MKPPTPTEPGTNLLIMVGRAIDYQSFTDLFLIWIGQESYMADKDAHIQARY
jgi:hypothetical protein